MGNKDDYLYRIEIIWIVYCYIEMVMRWVKLELDRKEFFKFGLVFCIYCLVIWYC